MKYAIVKIAGTQYKVSEGQEIETEKLDGKEGEIIVLEEVLLVADGEKVKIGNPLVKEAKVKAKVVKQFLGEKLDIFKFKAKTGYRRKTGFRPQNTLLKIEEINA